MAPVPRIAKLLDANTTAVYGPWVPIANALPDGLMLQLVGMGSGDRVQIFQSSQDDPTTAEQVKFDDYTTDGMWELTKPAAWVRAYRKSISGAGTVYCYLSYTELM